MTPAIAAAAFYAGLNGAILIWLTITVIRLRRRHRIVHGDGEMKSVAKAIRAQANFSETTPLALILLFALAFLGAGAALIHALGLVQTIGRLCHGIYFTGLSGNFRLRQIGMLCTLGVLSTASFLSILFALSELF